MLLPRAWRLSLLFVYIPLTACWWKESPLILASREGNIQEVNAQLSKAVDPNIKSKAGWPALVEAAFYSQDQICKVLIGSGASVDLANPNGFTALIEAAKKGSSGIVSVLLQAGADVNAKTTQEHWTALWWSAFGGHLDIAKTLIRAGADVNVTSVAGETPLMVSSARGNHDIVRLLIEHGADLDEHSFRLVIGLNADPNDARLFLEAGADPDYDFSDGETPVMIAAGYDNPTVVNEFIIHGADLNRQRESDGMTALLIAVQHKRLKTTQMLLRSGASTSIVSAEGNSALHEAALADDPALSRLLLRARVNQHQKNEAGDTALMLAARHCRAEAAKELIYGSTKTELLQFESLWRVSCQGEEKNDFFGKTVL